MQWDNPGFFPARYDERGAEYNPRGTIPFPPPRDAPVGYWQAGKHVLVWAAGIGQVARTATWASPVFDLRPELRGVGDVAPQGVPIWRSSHGTGGQLWVQVEGLLGVTYATVGLRAYVQEFGHVESPLVLSAIESPMEVTAALVGNGSPSGIVIVEPPGFPYPVRYWRVVLTFEYYLVHAGDPVFTVSAAYY